MNLANFDVVESDRLLRVGLRTVGTVLDTLLYVRSIRLRQAGRQAVANFAKSCSRDFKSLCHSGNLSQ
jgi:hypothetical protein